MFVVRIGWIATAEVLMPCLAEINRLVGLGTSSGAETEPLNVADRCLQR